MVIAVNTRLLLHNKLEGIGRFTHETLRIITQQHPEHQFIFIFDRKFSGEFVYSNNITPVVGFPQARHPVLWYMFFEWSIPVILRKYKADLFLSPDGWLSLSTHVKSMPVIHDLNFFHLPEFIPWHVRRYYHYFFPRFVKKANRIATVSMFSKEDIISLFNYDSDKIDVVYNGANELYKPISVSESAATRNRYSNGCPYFLFIGLIHPRKNLHSLISAFEGFKQSVNSNVKLLVVGSRKWWTEDMQRALDNSYFKEDIVFTGRVDDEDLLKITASALALVYASHFEGFGIPLLEAMYCDIPVISSQVSSLPEVGGDAVLYVDPSSVESIKSAMLTMFCDTNMRKKLIDKARIQRQKFTWEKTADLLWQSIDKCMKTDR
jgi:glycosyltransferase involved in cell wall biosynthesis